MYVILLQSLAGVVARGDRWIVKNPENRLRSKLNVDPMNSPRRQYTKTFIIVRMVRNCPACGVAEISTEISKRRALNRASHLIHLIEGIVSHDLFPMNSD
jgi:hypothetical protein